MGISVKLGQYTADEESGWSPRRVAFVSAAGVLLSILVILCCLAAGTPKATARTIAPEARETSLVGGETFASKNWKHLKPGETQQPLKTLDTDLSAPEWHAREAFKELKAMAVYEVKSPETPDKNEDEEMARSLFRVKS